MWKIELKRGKTISGGVVWIAQCGLVGGRERAETGGTDLNLVGNLGGNRRGIVGRRSVDLMVVILRLRASLVDAIATGFGGCSTGCIEEVEKKPTKVLRKRRCSFASRLAWEASRSQAAMALLTWWRSRSQLATSLIELSSTPFWSSLSSCLSSSFSLRSLPLKVSTSAPHLVL